MTKKLDVTMVTIAIRTMRAVADELYRGQDYYSADASYERNRAADRSAKIQLEDFGFKLRDDFRGHAISFGGVRATCTSSLIGAMDNWVRRAEAAIGGGQ